VFLTPHEECEGLYVTNVSASGFEVHELHHGQSNATFDYRIVALRRGFETVRSEDMTERWKKMNALPKITPERGIKPPTIPNVIRKSDNSPLPKLVPSTRPSFKFAGRKLINPQPYAKRRCSVKQSRRTGLGRIFLLKSTLLGAMVVPALAAYGQQEVDPTWYDPWVHAKVVVQPGNPRVADHKLQRKVSSVTPDAHNRATVWLHLREFRYQH